MGMKQCIAVFMKGLIYAEGVNVLPGNVTGPLFLIKLLNAMTITTPFAFIPRLIKSFGTSEVDTGYKVGIIASSMFVARIFFRLDKYDSKKVALVSATCLATSTLAFSFTNNFPWAVVTRFLQGASMGLVVINKKILAEFCDETNLSLGISIFASSYLFGMVLGPSLGSFLAFPSVLYPAIFSKDSIFAQFGALLPCGLIAIAFYLVKFLFWWLVPKQERNKACLASCFLYTMGLTLAVGFDVTFPLYAATTKEYGGFGFSTDDIGTTLMIVSMASLISQFTIVPKILYRFGARKSYLMSYILMVFVFPLVPLCSLIEDRKLFWVAAVFSSFAFRLVLSLGFTATNIFLNNAVPLNLVGSANGLAFSTSNLGRAIGVTSIGTLYGYSLTNVKDLPENKNPIRFPFNQYFVFFIFSIISLICGLCVYTLPKTIDKPYAGDLMESDNARDNA